MSKDANVKPLTVEDLHEVLIPAMERVFATKKDLESFAVREHMELLERDLAELKGDFVQFRDESLTNQDKMLKGQDILITEKVMRDHQKKKERKLWTIMIEATQEHSILSPKQLKQIKELEVF